MIVSQYKVVILKYVFKSKCLMRFMARFPISNIILQILNAKFFCIISYGIYLLNIEASINALDNMQITNSSKR